MKQAAAILLIGSLLLLASPALATEKVSDVYDQDSGSGEALIHVEDNIYLLIFYKDTDGSGDYTPGDTIIRVFRSKLMP